MSIAISMSIGKSMSMFKKIVFLVLPLSLVSCYEQERNCKDFKTGKFTSETTINDKKFTSTFERNDTIQIETFEGKTDTSKVRWINECECIMQKVNPKNREERKSVSVRILSTKEKTYTFEYSFVGDSKKQKGSVTKIE